MREQGNHFEPLPFKEWVERFNLTEGQARKLLLFREKNGLSQAVIKIGTKIYIDSERFLSWIEQRREANSKYER